MTLSNLTNGITSFGFPILPNLPFGKNSKVFFVDPINGRDGNRGNNLNHPLQTLEKAHSLCTAGNNDIVYLLSNGATNGSARQDEALTWSKDATHLVGLCAPSGNPRSRIAATSGVEFTPMVNWSADACVLENVSMFQGYDDASAQNCMAMTGQRNYIANTRISGMGHATAGDQAGSRSLTLSGDGENIFENCIIGLDTVARSTTNAEIELLSASNRNQFKNCKIESYADNAGHLFLKVGSGGMDRYCDFRDCLFDNVGTTAMTAALEMNASAGGFVNIFNSYCTGATDWTAADSTLVRLMTPAPNAATSGLAVTVDVTP